MVHVHRLFPHAQGKASRLAMRSAVCSSLRRGQGGGEHCLRLHGHFQAIEEDDWEEGKSCYVACMTKITRRENIFQGSSQTLVFEWLDPCFCCARQSLLSGSSRHGSNTSISDARPMLLLLLHANHSLEHKSFSVIYLSNKRRVCMQTAHVHPANTTQEGYVVES